MQVQNLERFIKKKKRKHATRGFKECPTHNCAGGQCLMLYNVLYIDLF